MTPASAHYQPLTPVAFLVRSASVWPTRVAVSLGDEHLTYDELLARTHSIIGVFKELKLKRGDRVATLLPNLPAMLTLHYAVPGAGMVLVPMNTRLAAQEYTYLLDHSGARCVVAHPRLRTVVESAIEKVRHAPEVLYVGESFDDATSAATPAPILIPEDETSVLSINYTSGTTGQPKGVMSTHRGAYLNSISNVFEAGFSPSTTYLWTLPMFHVNGWTHVWAVTAAGGRHVCLDVFHPTRVWELLAAESVTHFAGAPTLMSLVVEAAAACALPSRPSAIVAGASPAPAALKRLAEYFDIVHLYGLAETHGPFCACVTQADWHDLDEPTRAKHLARQGVVMLASDAVRVVSSGLRDVPADGRTIGEIVVRGNTVSAGYFRDEQATTEAYRDGWFHSGDLAVRHPDGYIEIRDRVKDIFICAGENVSTIEVEQTLQSHPAIRDAAVVGVPHRQLGEVPVAFVTMREPGAPLSAPEIQRWVRERMASFKVPHQIFVQEALPTTPTGKIKKAQLRAEAMAEVS